MITAARFLSLLFVALALAPAMLPDNWAALRRQWKYSHAVSAILDLVALIGVIISVQSGRKP